MPINLYSVSNHLAQENWTLISTEYKNLKTELEMKCPKGHIQFLSYGEWRKHPICNVCMGGDGKKIQKNKVPIKKIDTHRILALDAATVVTGYSVYDNGELVSYGTYKVDRSWSTERRINEVKKWLLTAINDWEPDFIGIEGIQLQSFGKGNLQVEMYRTLSNLQGVLVDAAFESSIDHDLVYPSSWRNYCNITGSVRENQKKAAQEKVKLWYGQDCTQDEADAICIGKYFVHILKSTKSSWGENI